MLKKFVFNLSLFLALSTLLIAEGNPGGGGDNGGGDNSGSNNPIITITPNSKNIIEGNSGTKSITFNISIDKCPDTSDINVNYYTQDGTATQNEDYIPVNGSITFNKDSCTKNRLITIKIKGDTDGEPNENFYLKIDASSSNNQDFSYNNRSSQITIENDDKYADLEIGKYVDSEKYSFNYGETIPYIIYIGNNGQYPTRVKIVDKLPPQLEYEGFENDENLDIGITCSNSGQRVECISSQNLESGDWTYVIIKAKVVAQESDYSDWLENIASVSSEDGLSDPDTTNNQDSISVAINPPGGKDGVTIQKSVDNTTPKVGDIVTFTIKATNIGFDKEIGIKDWFDKFDSSKDAFEIESWQIESEAYPGIMGFMSEAKVHCIEGAQNNEDEGDENILSCYTDGEYKHNDSFTIKVQAKVLRRGHLCNSAKAYDWGDYPDYYNYNWSDSDDVCVDATGNNPPQFTSIPNKRKKLGSNFALKLRNFVEDKDLPNETFTYSASNLPPGLNINSSTGKISGTIQKEPNVTYPKDYIVKVTVTDSYGATAEQTFTITVYTEPLKAADNIYKIKENKVLKSNFIKHKDKKYGKDKGIHIKLVSHTNPNRGILEILNNNGKFKYTPEPNESYITSFEYTITDDSGKTDTATVTIIVGDISDKGFELGFHKFKKINPKDTQNIIGNYLITGNTIECVTNKKNPQNGDELDKATCVNGGRDEYYNNKYAVKYIDIDDDNNTWNSSSANFTLPDTLYDSNDSKKTILWAALFWQGGVNNTYSFRDSNNQKHYNKFQRRAIKKDGGGYEYFVINQNNHKNETLNVDNTDINKVLFKIDNSNYVKVTAKKLYYDNSQHGKKGIYYAAYADVTKILQDANLTKGKHTATVANITANEGREQLVGNYAGWSLVIIYKEDLIKGKPRNISIYNGFVAMNGDGVNPSKGLPVELPINGFKLPKSGEVNAKLSVFAGEGEYIYGSKDTTYDKIYLKENNNSDTPEDNVPATDGGDPTNIFDAKLTNIDRDNIKDNNLLNTNAIDIDDYNVSSIVQKYRDRNKNINSLYIGLTSNDDYVTTSMLGFAVELYKPNLCYNYTLSFGSYVIPSIDNKIETPYGLLGDKKLTTRVAIESKEADFDLKDVKVIYDINDTSMLTYIPNTTMISPNGVNDYIDASNLTYNQTDSGFIMNIGKGATSNKGGIVGANERRFFKFDDQTKQAEINATFSLKASYKVNYGSGDIEMVKTFGADDICREYAYYNPTYGKFNITSSSASIANGGTPYNLYSQVANRGFNIKLFSYDNEVNPDKLKAFNGVVSFEPYNVDYFPNDAQLSCKNPDSNLAPEVFVDLKNKKSVEIRDVKYSFAARNVGFRVWYLKDMNGTIIQHHCNTNNGNYFDNLQPISQADDRCYRGIYHSHYKDDTKCQQECNSQGQGCYKCLKRYYGFAVCSRDNFAIRPESYYITIKDNKEDNATSSIKVADNKNQNTANLVAGYSYKFDINATTHTDDTATPGYMQIFKTDSINNIASFAWAPDSFATNCNDTNSSNIELVFFDGQTGRTKGVPKEKLEQVGRYSFSLLDKEWTMVDWSDSNATNHNILHHQKPGFSDEQTDCIVNSDIVDDSGKVGCEVSSIHKSYKNIYLRYYPYKFKLDNLKAYAGPTDSNKSIVFINTLDSTQNYPFGYADIGNEHMAYNIVGNFSAVSYTGKELTNFTKGCYADPIDFIIDANYTHQTPSITKELTYDLYEFDDNNTPTHNREQHQVDFANDQNITIAHSKNDFADNMKGKINIELGLNFKRDFNIPLNPRVVYFKDINITYHNQPSNLIVNQKSHKIYGDKIVDKNISFVYARVIPKKLFYDDVANNSVKTPIYIGLYCSLPNNLCAQRGVNINPNTYLTEPNWYKAINSIAIDSNITLNIDTSKANLSQNPVDIDSNGENSNLTVTKVNGISLPATVEIKTINPTDRWLLYNDFENKPPKYLYRVRFINPSGEWSGVGKTGHTIGNKEGQEKKTNRVDW